MPNPTHSEFEKRFDQHLARHYSIYATIVALIWIGYGGINGVTSLREVSANGLGRFATNFGLSRLPGYNSITSEDIGLFVAILGGSGLLIVGGVLVPFQIRFAIYLGLTGAVVLAFLTLMTLLKAPDVGVVVLGFLFPTFILVSGAVLHVALRERNAQSTPPEES